MSTPSSPADARTDTARQPVWDVHAHCIPPAVVADLRSGNGADGMRVETRDGEERVVHRQGPRYPLFPTLHDVEERLAMQDRDGIDIAAISLSPTMYLYWADASEAVDFARRANDSIAEMVAQAPDRLVGVAHLPMQDPDAALAEAKRATTELGLGGCQVAPVIGEQTLDLPEYADLLQQLQDAGVPLTLHPYFVGVGARAGLDKYYLTNMVGHPYQTAAGASRLIMSGTFDRFSQLEVVLLHGGGSLPYQVGRLDHGWNVRPEAHVCEQLPSTYLRRFTYDTLTHSARSLRFLIDLVGADRTAYGTDSPWDMGGGSPDEQFAGVEMTDDERAQITSTNAQRLYANARLR